MTLPLDGIRILEIGAYIAGPYAGAMLCAMGAEVVKVEPKGGDPFRRGAGNRDPYFRQYNAGKRSIAIDLKAPEGVALVKALLPGFDVLLENNRPGALDRLGLDAQTCRAIHPGLVYASASGFGDGGPLRDRPAYDSIGQTISGFYSIMNDAGDAQMLGGASADLATAMTTVMGVLAALVGRSRNADGTGSLMQTSLMEAMSGLTVDAVTSYYEHGVTPTRRSRHAQAQGYCLPTRDNGAITVHMSVSDKFFQAIAGAIGRPELASDDRFATYRARLANYLPLEAIFREAFVKRTRDEWMKILTETDVPHAPVLTVEEVVHHPQTDWLGMMEPEDDGLALVRPPVRFDGARPPRDFRVPEAGEHTREVAGAVLTADEVEALIGRGVLRVGGQG
ncbi:CaiB/BaiF CoA transferase family protein [Salipiger sp.]|uniref:CaiB/BaiF CoA transferase family protein n=1 Tax=Salipiger sp. TaxID=2078585 RepID=UPI003A97024D